VFDISIEIRRDKLPRTTGLRKTHEQMAAFDAGKALICQLQLSVAPWAAAYDGC
jgi:hypothetical protein